jgi:DNA-binding transcriptional LysR family regulator
VTVPYHAAAAAAVPGTQLVATLPSSFASQHMAPGITTVIPAPDEIGTVSFVMSWHPRLDNDAAQRWLRDTITETMSPISRERT